MLKGHSGVTINGQSRESPFKLCGNSAPLDCNVVNGGTALQ